MRNKNNSTGQPRTKQPHRRTFGPGPDPSSGSGSGFGINAGPSADRPGQTREPARPQTQQASHTPSASRPGSVPVQPKREGKPPTIITITEPGELMQALLAHQASKGRNFLKGLLARGQVFVNGTARTAYNYPLQPGDALEIRWEKVAAPPELAGLSILYEDDHLIVINKDSGLLSVSDGEEKDLTAYRQLNDHVRASAPESRIFVVHRLDRDTSGVMLFAKTEQAKLKLQENWQDAVLERTYIALAEGKVKRSDGTITSWLKETSTLRMYSSPTDNGGQKAITHYKVLRTQYNYSLLEMRLETGRKNQIRVHLHDIGHPVAGDKKYGARSNPIGRLGLHAQVLAFIHPATDEKMRFETAMPGKFLRVFAQKD